MNGSHSGEAPQAREAYQPRGLFYEDFELGRRYTTPRRTITRTDIVNYCGLSGDYNAPHADAEFCKTQPYGEPIAHGPLVLAIATGLQCQSGINDGTLVALLAVDEWRIERPVKDGDTIQLHLIPTEKRLTTRGSRGVVKVRREIVNQRGEIVQSMLATSMYLCRTLPGP